MDLFPITPKDKLEIYKIFGTSEEQVKRDVEIIQEWLKKQYHLPQQLPYDNFIEQFLLHNKFSVERTKHTIDDHFTLKTINPYFIENVASQPKIQPAENFASIFVMPKLGPNYERILIFLMVENPNPDIFEFHAFMRKIFAFMELYMRYNFSNGLISIVDYKGFGFEHLKKLDLVKYIKGFDVIFKGYTSRLHKTIILNAPGFFNVIFNAFKLVVNPKMVNRVHLCPDLESLHKTVSPEYLPKEYGGQLGPLAEHKKVLDRVYEKNEKFFMDTKNYRSNELLRIGKCKYSTIEGMDGTFKKITVD